MAIDCVKCNEMFQRAEFIRLRGGWKMRYERQKKLKPTLFCFSLAYSYL